MIEETIMDALKVDVVLISKVTTYASSPAIFTELAPQSAEFPYITINITRNQTIGDLMLQDMSLMVDYWGYGATRTNARIASERIEFLLENKQFTDDRYSSIRIWFYSGGWVEDTDPRAIHYNHQFTVKACRKKWINQL